MTTAQGPPRIEIDGQSPTDEQLSTAALDGYGHFTAMQVRSHRIRGLDLHLDRLTSAHREMFDEKLDGEVVRDYIRHALRTGTDADDASVRVYLRHIDDRPSVMITVRPPADMPAGPWRLQSVPYQRSVAHLKHLGDFGQGYFQRQARRNGFDEALLTDADGVISEGSITNIGFFDGLGVVWPDAPMLAGITMRLLQARIGAVGLTSRRAAVRLADVDSFDGAFVTNARGIASVAEIDDIVLPVDADRMAELAKAYARVGWDRL
jgi:branched-subunit amino acid aminotransferase/4-amino-4-deoxychorismate lyase